MAKRNTVPTEAKPDLESGAESPAPERKNAEGAIIRRAKKPVKLVEPLEDSTTEVEADVEAEVVEPKPVKLPDPMKLGKLAYAKDIPLFEYEPLGGGEFIYLPLEFERPDKVWLWELNIQPFLSQTWAWLDRAGVPRKVQRQCVSLPDAEYMDMFKAWFKAMGGGATPGE